MKTLLFTLDRTNLGIVLAQVGSYPQAGVKTKSYSYFGSIGEAGLHTPFNSIQVLDKKGENAAIHRKALPLSTTINLN
ncbi:MAG TPA: hypothetical protein PK497_05535 [Burkholderiaceae bacterium]|nr:hypothetical protein [Burkholderiaceae bacterium]HPH12911.1 hypothetical protein [Burkholderiaceae bacterium]